MAINELARNHFDAAAHWLEIAKEHAAAEAVNAAIVATGIAEQSIKLAEFCMRNHALVRNIDEDAPISVNQPGSVPPWGGPPLPDHIRDQIGGGR